jgi:hypothetical protein
MAATFATGLNCSVRRARGLSSRTTPTRWRIGVVFCGRGFEEALYAVVGCSGVRGDGVCMLRCCEGSSNVNIVCVAFQLLSSDHIV